MTFNELVEHFKTQTQVAQTLGISVSSVNQWRTDGIPLPRQYQIQVITDGALLADGYEPKRKPRSRA